MTTRRSILKTTVGGLALAGSGLAGRMSWAGLPSGTLEASSLQTLSGKQPLIKRAWRPPNFESPLATFKQVITPNDQFFVRWHLAGIPTINARAWQLNVGGEGAARELVFTLEQLKQEFEPVEPVAVCQCAGNRRGFSEPHVP